LDGDILTIVGCLDASEKAKKMVQDIISRFWSWIQFKSSEK
jgi:hypothetical protein